MPAKNESAEASKDAGRRRGTPNPDLEKGTPAPTEPERPRSRLSPRFCGGFNAVCAECMNSSQRDEAPVDNVLPPYADRAIEALARCRGLTKREREVLTFCCMGLKNSAIASSLEISVSAVRRHLRNLHKKTGTADKAELILNLWHSCELPRESRPESE